MSDVSDQKCPRCGAGIRANSKFCASCGTPLPEPSPVRAPERNPGGRRVWTVFTIVVVAAVATCIGIFIENLPGKPHQVIAAQPTVTGDFAPVKETIKPVHIEAVVTDGKLTIPVQSVVQNRMVEFELKSADHSVPLLSYITTDGKLVTSIRLCEPCNSQKFTIEGNELDCGNCETRWNLNTLEGLAGSCQKYPPDPIPSTINGDRVTIEVSEILNWKIRL